PLQFAADFNLEPWRQFAPVTGSQLLQTSHLTRPKGLVVVDPVDSAQPLDAVDMLDTFVDEAIALAVQPTVVFLSNGRHSHYAPYLRIATQIRAQRAYQLARINFVCLRTSRSAIDLHARWIDNVISHAMLYQESMQPESV